MRDDNTRILNVQAGQLDTAIFMPFSRVAELKKDSNLTVHLDPSTREDHLLINHEHGALAKKEVRQALDMAIDEQAVVDTVTFGYGESNAARLPAERRWSTVRRGRSRGEHLYRRPCKRRAIASPHAKPADRT